MERPHPWRISAAYLLMAGGCILCGGLSASAQATLPGLPAPTPPPASLSNEAIAEAATSREAQLEERVRRLEALIAAQQAKTPAASTPAASAPAPATGPLPASMNYPHATGPPTALSSPPPVPPPSTKFNMPPDFFNFPLKARFGQGFEFRSADDEFVLQFHDLTQIDYRGYTQGGQQPVKDTFAVPRQWFIFSGRLGKPYEYFVSVQDAYDTILPLDVFGNIHYDDRLQLKVGRFKSPFTYEFYAIGPQAFIQPETSLFFNNFGLNRQVGAMAWGQLFAKKVDYSAAIMNTVRNGNLDVNDGKDFVGYLNYRPFLMDEGSPLQFLNFGGSVLAGEGVNPSNPQTLRTSVATSGNPILGTSFLTFNNNAREAGLRAFYDLHVALYSNHLSLIAEWEGGSQQYALANNLSQRTRVPVEGFYVQAGYFITGETVSSRGVVNPVRNFDLRPDHLGPGAIELTTRYNYMTLGQQVFSGGFADPNTGTRNLNMTDVGVNWYWTQNIKWVFDWQHVEFGSPVAFAPGRFQSTSDMFTARFQVFF